MSAYIPKGRTIHRVKVPLKDGGSKVCSTGTRDRNLARKMEAMVKELGRKELRAWDILGAVTARRLSLATLWDWWIEDGRDVRKVRARVADSDLATHLPAWIATVRLRASASTASHYAQAVQTLKAPDGSLRRSSLTTERLRAWLANLTVTRYELVDGKRTPKHVPLKTGSRRRYYAALASFVAYLKSVGAVSGDVLADVPTPNAGVPRDRYLDTDEARSLADAQPEPFRTIAALMAGTGIELSVILGLRKADVEEAHREVHARGTKTLHRGPWRDRFVRVASWAWPYLERHLEGLERKALLFPDIDRWDVGDAHRAACERLEIRDYAPRDHRHTWTVRMVKSGAPIEEIVRQGGWKDGTLILRVYGRYVPSREDREKWEQIAAAQDDAGTRSGTQPGDTP